MAPETTNQSYNERYSIPPPSDRRKTPDHSPPVIMTSRPQSETENPYHHPSREPYEGGFVSVDESPYRLREILQVIKLLLLLFNLK